MSQSFFNNKKTPSWSDTPDRSFKSSSNDSPVCDLCQGFSCVSCMLSNNKPSKKRKITEGVQSNLIQQQSQQLQNKNNNNNQNNNFDILNGPPAHNTRSALQRSHSDNASSLSASQNTILSSPIPSKSRTELTTPQISGKGLSDSSATSPKNTKMNANNVIDLVNEPSKPQTSQGAQNAKGLLCPVCTKVIPTATNEASLNVHIDDCLSMKLLEEENTVPKSAPVVEQPLMNAFMNLANMPQATVDLNAMQAFQQLIQQQQQQQQQQQKLPKPKSVLETRKKEYVKHYDDEDDEHWSDEEEEQEDSYQDYNEYESTEQLGKVRCPYLGCGVGYIAQEEFGKHVLESHKGGYQKHLCPLCAADTGYSVHKGTNLYRHVQQYHAFFTANVTAETTNKPQPKPQHIEFVEEVLAKDMDTECCICFEQFETGNTVARLPCLCIFHKTCVVRWFEKEKRCPVHEEIPQS